ncbi:probable cytochrome P450 12e1, mitochondrial [Scaptodrosophila lebanonensis]|uniref:Probable cytochrome P450 12e1, mitochondrial n=1 Tax=Drosophila lebanonensis TaxID=7225 RepID=A0A6J2T4Z9_DROLE|nr:probable cytochrome P450 12e1, mitochondrial [Scaptodrosophila lebanonensis]
MLCRQLYVQRRFCARLSVRAVNTKAGQVLEPVPSVALEQAKPFAELPGPSKLEMIRAFLPGGRYRGKPVFEMFMDLARRHGEIFRLPSIASNEVVLTMNPKDYEIIFRNEGQWPYRRSFETFTYYKTVHRRDVFGADDGLVSGNGPEWGKMRTAVNPILLQPRNARLYIKNLLQVNNEFLQRIRNIRDPNTLEMPDDFAEDIRRLVLESIGSVALNTHLGLLGAQRESEEAKQMIKALENIIEIGFELDMLPAIWKYVPIPKFKLMMRSLDTITDICIKNIEEAINRIESTAKDSQVTNDADLEKSLLEKLLRHDRRTAIIVAMDLLFAGTDPTVVSLSGILLLLAKNPSKQARLLEELQNVLPSKDAPLTMDNMQNLPYLRACIKEGIRLYPVGPGTLRRMPHDVVLSGYRVVAGTDVGIAANIQVANSEEFVPRVREFLPERWLRNESANLVGDIASPFMYLPFGFGPRSCAGKRIVDMILEIAVARLVRNFDIGFNYPIENAFKAQFFVKPNIPFNFKFVEREK